MKKYNVAILGATGAVGQEFLNLIEERNFPFAELKMLASKRSAGKKIQFMGKEYTVEEATEDSFKGVDIALFAGGAASKTFAPAAVKAGAVVIDNSSAFRMDPEVPLVVPEVNPEAIANHKGIIANPNCSTIIMVMALKRTAVFRKAVILCPCDFPEQISLRGLPDTIPQNEGQIPGCGMVLLFQGTPVRQCQCLRGIQPIGRNEPGIFTADLLRFFIHCLCKSM